MASPLRDCVSLSRLGWMQLQLSSSGLVTQPSVCWDHLTSGALQHGQHPGHQLCNVSTSMQPRLINNDFYRIFIKLYNIGIIKI